MPANIVDARVDNFETELVKAAEAQGPGGVVLILFLGDLVPSTGESWCPDCSRVEPAIYRQVNRSERPVTMVRVYVGDKTAWRTRDHPLRIDRRFRITGVPTLVRWEGGAVPPGARLEGDEADDKYKLQRLLTSTSSATPPRSRASSRSSSTSSRGSASSSPRTTSKSSSSYTSKRTFSSA